MSTKERYLGISFKPGERDLINWKEKEKKNGRSLSVFVKQAIREKIEKTESGHLQQSDILHAIEEYQNRTYEVLQKIVLQLRILTGDTGLIIQEKKQSFFVTEAENLLDQKCAEAGWE